MPRGHIHVYAKAAAELAKDLPLDPGTETQLEAAVEPVYLGPGQTILVSAGTVLIACEGPKRVMFQVDGNTSHSWETIDGTCVIGLYEELVKFDGSFGFSVEGEPGSTAPHVKCYLVPHATLETLSESVPWVRDFLRRFYQDVIEFQDYFASELRRGLVDCFLPKNMGTIPGPYVSESVVMKLFVMQADASELDALLPPRVKLLPFRRNRCMLVLCSFGGLTPDHGIGPQNKYDYTETSLFVPARTGLLPGAFVPALFPNNYLAILLGRELYGFPKRYGYTLMREPDNLAALFVDEQLEALARWTKKDELEADEFAAALCKDLLGDCWVTSKLAGAAGRLFAEVNKLDNPPAMQLLPDVPVFVRKQVPATAFRCETKPFYRTDQLMRVPFDAADFREFKRLDEPKLKLSGKALPIQGDCVSAYEVALDLKCGESQVIHRYTPPWRWLELGVRSGGMVLSDLATLCRALAKEIWSAVQPPSPSPLPGTGEISPPP